MNSVPSIEVETIVEQLKNLIEENFGIDTEGVDTETQLFNGGLHLSSIQMIELTVSTENCFGKRFAEQDMIEENFSTVGIMAETVCRSLFEQ